MKKIIKYIIYSLSLGGISLSYAQVNIVANPSFEDTVRCPNNVAQMIIPSACKDWYDPNGSTSDYYNSCSYYYSSVPSNFTGWQYAKSGVSYGGFSSLTGKEYIQEKLDSVLYLNHTYCIEFYVSLANNFNIASNNIGMYISDSPPAPPAILSTYSNCIPQINDTAIPPLLVF